MHHYFIIQSPIFIKIALHQNITLLINMIDSFIIIKYCISTYSQQSYLDVAREFAADDLLHALLGQLGVLLEGQGQLRVTLQTQDAVEL